MKYIIYCRKSQEDKDRQILSIPAQIAELKEFAKREHLEIVEIIEEEKTAKVPGREKFNEMVRKIEKGVAQGIIAWHPDRLARNSIDGGKIIYLLDDRKLLDLKFPQFWFDSTPQGKFMLGMAFNQSKYYVDNLSENVKRGIRHKLRNGIWPKTPPIGYVNNPKTKGIDIDPERAKTMKKAFELFATERKSFTQISDFLFKNGIKTKVGKPLKVDQLKAMLSNSYYIGPFKYSGEVYQGSQKLFISKELFKRVQEKVHKIERPRGKGGHNFAFGGLMRCGECGAAITAEEKSKYFKRTDRKAHYIYYRCTKKIKPCTQRYVEQNELEKQFRKAFDDVALPQSWAVNWYKWLDEDEILEKQNAQDNILQLEEKLPILEEKLNKLLDSFLEGVVDSETYKNKKNEFFDEKLKIQEDLAKIRAGGSSWLEPFSEWVGSALSCAKIARAKNTCEDLAIFSKTVGSDFFLTNRQLSINYKLGFAELQDGLAPHSQSLGLPTIIIQAGLSGLEPEKELLERPMIPFHHSPKY